MMLNMGVSQLLNLDDFYETKEELLQSPHIVNLTQNNIYKNQYGDFIFQDSRICIFQQNSTTVPKGRHAIPL